ncbi:hypothetical protein GCM10010964_43690 [Caldovatus sediminis]|uniref:Tail fiber protein n=1 Tax=Caldovatus sediminis TaxID=2041189 RepID=A0A8J2ZFY4_9PROT|nr:hypothetical protein [Caldovatus sediminis]GGG51771.1 hypothetical protein GCM10010964_43690 [Caldovatus sediminis]
MLGNAIVETANAPGTGTVSLIGAATGRVRFRSQFASGAKVFYWIQDATQLEAGVGTLTHGSPDTISRDTVLWNSAGTTAKLNFAGACTVYCEVPASRMAYIGQNGGLSVDAAGVSLPMYGGTATGNARNIRVACAPAPPALVDGMRVHFRAAFAASTDCTLRVNSLATKPLNVFRAGALVASWTGDWAAGQWLDCFYDAAADCFVLDRPAYADWAPGDVRTTYRSTAAAGWVLMNDGSIGAAGSGATTRANADTWRLYELLWNTVADTWAPVSGGRGASALADFNAGKTLTLPRALGRALAVAGAGSGLTSRALGQWLGAETHALSIAEMPAHNHTGSTGAAGAHSHTASADTQGAHAHLIEFPRGLNGVNQAGGAGQAIGPSSGWSDTQGAHSHTITVNAVSDHTHTVSIANAGGGGAHNNMQPTGFLNVMIKL